MLLKLGADPRVYVDDGSTPEQVHKGRQNPRGTLTPPLPKLSGAWWLSWLGPDLPGPSSPSPYGSPRLELSWQRAIKTTAPDFRGPLARVLFSLDPQSTLEVLFPRKVGKQQGSWGQRGGPGVEGSIRPAHLDPHSGSSSLASGNSTRAFSQALSWKPREAGFLPGPGGLVR